MLISLWSIFAGNFCFIIETSVTVKIFIMVGRSENENILFLIGFAPKIVVFIVRFSDHVIKKAFY